MRRPVATAIACCTLSLSASTLAAQRIADIRPIGVMASRSAEHAEARAAQVRVWHADSLTGPPQRLWPSFALGGAIIGGVTVAGFALAQCDQGCKDDGSLAMLPPYVIAGAVIGGLIGGLVGLIVDDARRNSGQAATVAAP